MTITLESFKSLYVNPIMLPAGMSVIDAFSPKLDFMRQVECEHHDEKVRLIILLFDSNTPLNGFGNELGERAIKACELSKISYDKKEIAYPEWVKACLEGRDSAFNYMSVLYVSVTNSSEFAIYQTFNFSRLRYAAKIMSGDAGARKELVEVEKEIESRRKKLFQYQVSHQQQIDLDAFIVEASLDLSAEGVARLRREAKESGKELFPEFSQYNED